jgi:D-beta-D-heptose 7-phosphate kinase/D-beta-D-heptose 1-phosphate adenosyltransferase
MINVIPTEEELNLAINSLHYTRDNSIKKDYLNKEFIKPWGKEYLTYQNKNIGIWILHINKNKKTSLHCHFKKGTLLIVLSGCFCIELYNDKYHILNECEILYIPPNTFHGLLSYCEEGIIIEIEIYDNTIEYTDKNDLLRLKDEYNRDKNTYENSVTEVELDESKSINFHTKNIFNYKNIIIKIDNNVEKCDKCVLLNGYIFQNNILSAGSIIDNNYLKLISNDVLFMKIFNNYIFENKKIIYSKKHLNDIVNISKFKNIGLTSGCFDIIHTGHIDNLKKCKNICDTFFVCLSSDKQIKELKGEKRPINCLEDRILLLSNLNFIDYIILYDEIDNTSEKELDNIINILKPEYWFKGYEYDITTIKQKHPSLKKIILHENIVNKSTTNIINKINKITNHTS